MTLARPAIVAVGRHELRRRWPSLLVLAVVAGLVAATVTGTLALARRGSTAYDRLIEAGHVEDAQVRVFADPSIAEEVVELPTVAAAWVTSVAIGRVDGPGVRYVGVLSGPPAPDELFTPVLVTGRAPSESAPDEVVLDERSAEGLGLEPGDTFTLQMLTPEEVAQFDVGFGEPDGPRLELTVTGTIRVPPGSLEGAPVVGGPAFHERYAEQVRAGVDVLVRLRDGQQGIEEFRAQVEELAATVESPAGAEEFEPLTVIETRARQTEVAASARVLTIGLASFAAIAALAGLYIVGQTLGRLQSTGAGDQRIEAALGLTSTERTLARVLPTLPFAAVAALVCVSGSLALAALDPLGPLARVEPSPGWAPNVAFTTVGAVATAGTFLLLAAAASRRAGRSRSAGTADPVGAGGRRAARLSSRPWVVAGTGLALVPGRGERSVPVRSALLATGLAVAGVLASLTFAASLDRLEAEPTRWGWPGELSVIDVTDEIVAELAADARVDAVGTVDTAPVTVQGATLPGYSLEDQHGQVDWTVLDGRLPAAAGEIALGTRAAEQLGAGPGDTVEVTDVSGAARELHVVGIALAPPTDGSRLGSGVIVAPGALDELGRSQAFREANVVLSPEADAGATLADLSQRYEAVERRPPPEVQNLADLGLLPVALGGFLLLLGCVALAHTLALTVRRRAGELAVLRALGFTRRQVSATVVATAVTAVVVGLAVGIPLGLGIGRVAWSVAATDAGVAPTASIPWVAVAAAAVGALVLAGLLGWLPARRAARLDPVSLLRAE